MLLLLLHRRLPLAHLRLALTLLPLRPHDPILHRKLLHQLPLHLLQVVLLLWRRKALKFRVLKHGPPGIGELRLLFEGEGELLLRGLLLLWVLLGMLAGWRGRWHHPWWTR